MVAFDAIDYENKFYLTQEPLWSLNDLKNQGYIEITDHIQYLKI